MFQDLRAITKDLTLVSSVLEGEEKGDKIMPETCPTDTVVRGLGAWWGDPRYCWRVVKVLAPHSASSGTIPAWRVALQLLGGGERPGSWGCWSPLTLGRERIVPRQI